MDNLFENLIRSDNPLESARLVVAPYCKKKLEKYILECNKCNLPFDKKTCYGNPNANILIINDIATDNQEIDNYFNYIIEQSKIDVSDLFVINAVSCICKRKDGDKYVSTIPTYNIIKECKTFVDYAVKFVNPKIIILMGASALNQYCLNDEALGDWIENKKNQKYYFYNIPTSITYSIQNVLHLNKLNQKMSTDKLNHIILTYQKAQNYINSIK